MADDFEACIADLRMPVTQRRAIRATDFKRRHMEAVRRELDHDYEARNGLNPKPSTDADPTELSNTSRS